MTTSPPTIEDVLAWAREQDARYKRRLFQDVDTKRISSDVAARERHLSESVVKCLEALHACSELKSSATHARALDDRDRIVCTIRRDAISLTFVADAPEIIGNVDARRTAVQRFERRLVRLARSTRSI